MCGLRQERTARPGRWSFVARYKQPVSEIRGYDGFVDVYYEGMRYVVCA